MQYVQNKRSFLLDNYFDFTLILHCKIYAKSVGVGDSICYPRSTNEQELDCKHYMDCSAEDSC